MIAWLDANGLALVAMIVAASTAVSNVVTFLNSFRANKKTKSKFNNIDEAIKITKGEIEKSFKNAKFDNNFKVDLSNKLDKKLDEWGSKMLHKLVEYEEQQTKLAVFNATILSRTAAYNKLTNEEKQVLSELIEKSTNIDITD